MRSNRVMRLGGATLLVAGSLAMAGPGAAAEAPVSCSAPELADIEGALLKARVAVAAGDEELLRSSLTSARDELDGIVETCWGAAASPGPASSPGPIGSPAATVAPIELGGSTTLGGHGLAYPADLSPVEGDLLRPVDDGEHVAAAITFADSAASGELLGGPLEVAVPDGFRVVSLAVGDPGAALASTGAFEPSETVAAEPAAALATLGDRIEQATADSDAPIVATSTRVIAFPDGSDGALLTVDFTGPEGGILARGGFVLRALADGQWALGVAVASEAGFERIGQELGATVASITEG